MQVDTVYAGQGDNAIVSHKKEAIVVDVHWPEDRKDERKKEINDILEGKGVRGIIITGYDKDHGDPEGLEYYLDTYKKVGWVLMPKAYDGEDKKKQKELQRICKKAGVKYKETSLEKDGSEPEWLKGLMGRNFEAKLFSPHNEDANNSNNAGIVIRISVEDEWAYLVTGDTQNGRWKKINELFKGALRSEGVSIPHHGAENGSNEKTAALVKAEQAVASAGVDNQYGHPNEEAMEIWRKHGEASATNNHGGNSLTTWYDTGRRRLITARREEFESIMETQAKRSRSPIIIAGTGGASGIAYGG